MNGTEEEDFWELHWEKKNETQAPDGPIDTTQWTDMLSHYYNTDETQLMMYQLNRWAGLLSILCSVFVIQSIARHPVVRKEVSSRIMMALSVCDILYSFFGSFLGPWPAPKGMAYGSVGNLQLCAAAGVLSSTGFYCSTYYTASLAICYLLMIRYSWNERKLKRAQFFLLLVPLLLYLPFLILSLAWEGESFNGTQCSQQSVYPTGCDDATGIPCIRGGKFSETIYKEGKWYEGGLLYLVFPSLICIPIVIVCMTLMFWTVYRQERANDSYRHRGSITAAQSRMYSRQVAVQGILYVFAFLAVELPWVVGVFLWGRAFRDPRPASIAQASLVPLQGFWNALVYLRPRYWPRIMTWCRSLRCNWRRKLLATKTVTRKDDSDTMPATSEFNHACSSFLGKKDGGQCEEKREEEEEKEETKKEEESNV